MNSILPVSYYEELAKMKPQPNEKASHNTTLSGSIFNNAAKRMWPRRPSQQQAPALRTSQQSKSVSRAPIQPGPAAFVADWSLVALLFQVWNYLIPNISLVKQAAKRTNKHFPLTL